MIIRLTEKLRRKIKAPKLEYHRPVADNPFSDWTSHLFTAKRVQYIIFTHSISLYSVVMYGKGIADESSYTSRVLDELCEFMIDDRREHIYRLRIAPAAATVQFSKTGDKRVLGSINDMVFLAKVNMIEGNLPPYDVSFKLNDTPFSMLDYHIPAKIIDNLFIESIREKIQK